MLVPRLANTVPNPEFLDFPNFVLTTGAYNYLAAWSTDANGLAPVEESNVVFPNLEGRSLFRIRRIGYDDALVVSTFVDGVCALVVDPTSMRLMTRLHATHTHYEDGSVMLALAIAHASDSSSSSRIIVGGGCYGQNVMNSPLGVFDATSGQLLHSLDTEMTLPHCAFTDPGLPDELFLVGNKTLRHYDLVRGVADFSLNEFGNLKAVSACPEYDLFATSTCHIAKSITLYDKRNPTGPVRVDTTPMGCYSLHFVPERHLLLCGLTGGSIGINDLRMGLTSILKMQQHQLHQNVYHWIYDMVRLTDKHFISVSEDGTVAKWRCDGNCFSESNGNGNGLIVGSGKHYGVETFPGLRDVESLMRAGEREDWEERVGWSLEVEELLRVKVEIVGCEVLLVGKAFVL